jgi:hypothetical protein
MIAEEWMAADPTAPILDSPRSYPYNRPFRRALPGGLGAQVAQLVEHCTENAGVGGSIPPLGTKILQHLDLTNKWRPGLQKWDTPAFLPPSLLPIR